MTPPVVIGAALLGAACGPYLRALVFRSSRADGVSRRHCPHCAGPVVPARPTGPLLGGWVSGRCPGCRGRLAPPVGTLELVTAAVFAALAIRVDSMPLLVALCWFGALAVALSAVDVAVHRLPDRLTVTAGCGLVAGVAVTALAEHQPGALVRAVLGGMGLFAGYVLLAVASPTSLGFGDCKLAAGLGAVLGWFGWSTVLTGTLAAFVLAGGLGLVLVLLGRAGRKDPIPFGPFMLLGALAAVLVS